MLKALLTAVILLGPAALNAAPQSEPRTPQLLNASVRAAVPGVDSLFVLDEEQMTKLAELAKKTLHSEELTAARKTTRDKSADRKSKNAARKIISEARGEFEKKAVALLPEDQQKLVSKMYASEEEVRKKAQEKFRPRLKEAQGDRKALRKIRKEMTTARNAELREAVLALLSEEQRKSVEIAVKKRAEAQEKRRARRGKKDDGDKGGDGGGSKDKGKKDDAGGSSKKAIDA